MVKNKRGIAPAMRKQETFSHRSYQAYKGEGRYTLRHWDTDIATVDEDGKILYFDTGYYSNTTSWFQGQIIRNALSEAGREQMRELLGSNKLRSIAIEAGNF